MQLKTGRFSVKRTLLLLGGLATFNGQWHLLCSGHVTDGSCDPTSQWVASDYYTGQWIASQFAYPAGP